MNCGRFRSTPDLAANGGVSSGHWIYESYGCANPPNCWRAVGTFSTAFL
jgi:hypothetical protein